MQVNIKRLLSFLVVLAMVLSMTPVTGIPAIEAKAETAETEVTETVPETTETPDATESTDATEAPEVEETVKTPVWGEFDPKACDGKAYCPACGEAAGVIEWTEISSASDAPGYLADEVGLNSDVDKDGTLEEVTDKHYYLANDITYVDGAQWIGLHGVGGCIHLNGHTLSSSSRIFAGGTGAYMNIIAGEGGAFEYTGACHTSGIATSVPTNLYGGTYTSTQATDAAVYKPIIQVTGKTNLYDVTVNGRMELASGTTTFYGATTANNVTIDTYLTNINGTTGTAKGKLVIDKDWTGTANLTVADSAFENYVLDVAKGAAEGDFTGTLTCNGAPLSNQDGTLMADTTFNPDAATNYCRVCDAFVAWEALPETVPTIGTDGACLHYYVPADMTATGEKSAFLFVADSNGEDVANVAPKVCLYLNNNTLTLTQYLFAGFGGVVNVIGDGKLTTTGSNLIVANTSTVNLYGGTYIAKTGGTALTMGGSKSKVNLYNDAKLEGWVDVKAGSVTLNDKATIEGLNHTGGTITAAEGWIGYLKNAAGKYVELVDGVWTVVTKTPVWGEFDPKACDGKAYCPACGEAAGVIEWTEISSASDAPGYLADEVGLNSDVDKDGTLEEVTDKHYYLANDITYVDGAQWIGLHGVGGCIHLNGHTLSSSSRIFAGGTGAYMNIIAGEGGAFEYTGACHTSGIMTSVPTNLYGGTYTSTQATDAAVYKPIIQVTGKTNLYDVTVNGRMELASGTTTFYGATTANNVTIDTYLTNINGTTGTAKGKLVIDKDWTGSATLTVRDGIYADGVISTTYGAATGDFTGTLKLSDGTKLVNNNGVLQMDTTFNPDATTNYCRACDAFVAWEALPETLNTYETFKTPGHFHYYVLENMTNTDNMLFGATASDYSFCLNLNGNTLTLGGQIYGCCGNRINIIGDGTVIGTGARVFYGASCRINLYGGTYVAPAGKALFACETGTPRLYAREDAKLQGNVAVSMGILELHDQAIVENITITGGKTTFKTGWSGTAVVTAAEALMSDNTINVANAYVEDGATGIIKSVAGFKTNVVDHAIVLNDPEPGVFNPLAYNGYAYCEDCGKLVEWIDFNDFVEKNGFYDGSSTARILSEPGTLTYHFYLSDNLNYTTCVMYTYENVIFNLNGHDINPVAKAGETEITASYVFFSSQGVVLLNTAEKMSTVTGWKTPEVDKPAGNATVLYVGGGGATSWARLYDNVTLTTHEDCDTDAPVVNISTSGGKFYMEGGVIDVSNKVNTDYPTAVYVQGRTALHNDKPCTGYFYMNGGEIKGGTSETGAGAVQIGSRSTGADFLDGAYFYMTGGTISGGKGKSGGNLLINKNCAEASITGGTITGGQATVSGGNIYCHSANLTIGKNATISNGSIPFINMSTLGKGGGNIYFANGTFTTSGVITGGTVETFMGAGGNIFLDGSSSANGISFVMNGGEISNGKLPFVNEPKYGNADFDGQSYGANIRGYKVTEIKLLGGTITGGQGGCPEKADGRDVYIACHKDVVTQMTIGDVTINGAIHLAQHELTLTGAPKITSDDSKNGLTVGETVEMNISGLTDGAHIDLSNIVANIPLTVACDNAEALKAYFTVIGMGGAVLNVVERQLIVIGVAIIDGEKATWYATAAEAIAAYTADDYAAGKYIQLGLENAVALPDGKYLIDLAGHVAGEVAISGTGNPANTVVHLFDSANTDFDGFRTVTVANTVTLAERDHTVNIEGEAYRFIIVTDAEGKTSAHRLDMAVNGVTLNTEKVGLRYNAEYKCDAYLDEKISAYGVILSVKDMPGTVLDSTDQRTVLTNFEPVNNTVTSTSSSVVGIFKEDRTPELNAELGKMKIYANAYIELDLDGDRAADILVADNENVGQPAGTAWSLYDALKNIDENWDDFADDQEAVKAFYDDWFDLGAGAYADDFTNIDVKMDVEGGNGGEGVTEEETDIPVVINPTEQA